MRKSGPKRRADAKGEKKVDLLAVEIGRLTKRARAREKAAGPAQIFIADTAKALAEIDASTTSLTRLPKAARRRY